MPIDYDPELEAELLTKEFAGKPHSSQEEVLLNNNIIPLPKPKYNPNTKKNEYSALLGAGKFGQVFQAVYQGKQVAVKIIPHNKIWSGYSGGGEEEVGRWKAILQIADSMPPNLKKHLPKIYNFIFDETSNSDIIIMEQLAPLPTNLAEKIFNYLKYEERPLQNPEIPLSKNELEKRNLEVLNQREKQNVDNFIQIFKNTTVVYNIFQKNINNYNKFYQLTNHPAFWDNLFLKILNFYPHDAIKMKEVKEDFTHFLLSQIDLAAKILPPEYQESIIQFFNLKGEKLANDIFYDLTKLSSKISFPAFSSDYIPEDLNAIPEIASLLETLLYLKSKGVAWADVHHNNLMIRPSTGDLVVIDVALWKI